MAQLMNQIITSDELLAVFKSSRLPRLGYTFKKACDAPAVLTAMQSWVKAQHKKHAALPAKKVSHQSIACPQQTALF